jgi:NAD(P)-dependent dehydrogenase (short-subunit alcohol dehydrogenase family)
MSLPGSDNPSFFDIDGKVILVTGATGQVGFQLCRCLVSSGAYVIGVDLKMDNSKMVSSESIEYLPVDITKKKNIVNLFARLEKQSQKIDVLINNAGVSCFTKYEDRSEEELDFVIDVNLKGTFFLIQQFSIHANSLEKDRSIINIGSVYGLLSPDPRIYSSTDRKSSEVYGASKAGVIQMTKYFAVHLASKGIRVNAISPGGIYNVEEPQSEEFITEYSLRNPMHRMAMVEEIVGCVIFLASDGSSYINGQNIVIDGGMSCW